MEYNYRALVVDDEVQIESACRSYKKHLKEMGIAIDFDVINNETEYDDSKPYDILLVDYDLRKGYSDKIMGDAFIKKFREKNKVSKVIFYSSSFEYDNTNRKYKFPFSPKESFELINILQVDRIAYRNNFNMMIEVIKSCCDQIDLLPLVLIRLLDEYKKENIGVSYTTSAGEEIDATLLLDELMNDSSEGRNFRRKMIDTILSVLLNYKY